MQTLEYNWGDRELGAPFKWGGVRPGQGDSTILDGFDIGSAIMERGHWGWAGPGGARARGPA